jgi:alkylation response protein AidB-like acyl-CoA dehydrogenase
MEKLQQERLTCAVGAVCGAEGILAWTMDFCRKTNRGGRPMSKSQAVQFELVEMAADVKVGRTFVDKLVADHIEKKNIVVETAMAKFWTTDLANRTADRALSILGDTGTVESCTLVRAWRDVRVMSIFAGTNEIMKGIAAKFMGL